MQEGEVAIILMKLVMEGSHFLVISHLDMEMFGLRLDLHHFHQNQKNFSIAFLPMHSLGEGINLIVLVEEEHQMKKLLKMMQVKKGMI
jgi:hypothetical protein